MGTQWAMPSLVSDAKSCKFSTAHAITNVQHSSCNVQHECLHHPTCNTRHRRARPPPSHKHQAERRNSHEKYVTIEPVLWGGPAPLRWQQLVSCAGTESRFRESAAPKLRLQQTDLSTTSGEPVPGCSVVRFETPVIIVVRSVTDCAAEYAAPVATLKQR